jgi:predicted negative regulator of RcsB-dependent stress response
MKEQEKISTEGRTPWWKRNIAALVILSILILIFALLFCIIGQAGYNQTILR